jgi:3-hydroxyacyl-CoA dehydrogenase
MSECDLIEAIVENLEQKRRLCRAESVGDRTIFCPIRRRARITELKATTKRPDRFAASISSTLLL